MDVGFDDDQFVKHDDTGRPKTVSTVTDYRQSFEKYLGKSYG